MRRVRPKSDARAASGGIGYSREFLERLAHILVHTGHSPKRLAQEFRQICRGLKEPVHPWNPAHLNDVADLPHVIACWHADPQYVNSQGEPLALPLKARGRSLTALIARALPHEDPIDVLQSLTRLRWVRRRGGQYVPTARQLLFKKHGTSGRVHGLLALLGILRTIEYNVSPASRSSTILERAAVIPRFPVRALPVFHRRIKALAADFLWTADNTMRKPELRWKAEPTTRLGVGVFAFEDPLITGTPKARPRAQRLVRPDRRSARSRRKGRR